LLSFCISDGCIHCGTQGPQQQALVNRSRLPPAHNRYTKRLSVSATVYVLIMRTQVSQGAYSTPETLKVRDRPRARNWQFEGMELGDQRQVPRHEGTRKFIKGDFGKITNHGRRYTLCDSETYKRHPCRYSNCRARVLQSTSNLN
jgi:hypothetical protein